MANNIFVTILNKAIFANVDFKYPYALSTIHMACNVIGSQLYFFFARFIYSFTSSLPILPPLISSSLIPTSLPACLCLRNQKPKQLEGSSRGPIFLLSIVFALNIAIGNTSLRWVSVNFNQVFRALVPAIVMIISTLYYGKTYSSQRKLAIIPIVIGVALTFYGGVYLHPTPIPSPSPSLPSSSTKI